MNLSKKKIVSCLVALSSLVLLFFYFKIYPVTGGILSLFNDQSLFSNLSAISRKYEKGISNKVVFFISGTEDSGLFESAEEIYQGLIATEYFEKINLNLDSNQYSQIYQFYWKYRHLLLTDAQIQKVHNNNTSDLKQEALGKIYSPFFSAASRLKEDPLLLMDEFYSNLSVFKGLEVYKDKLVVKAEQVHIFMEGTLKEGKGGPAFKKIQELKQQYPRVRVSSTSLSFYEHYAKSQSRFESTTLSILSLVLISLLFSYYFREMWSLFLVLFTILTSSTLSFYLSSLIFGNFHFMTLLLCISLLGVIADYTIHYLVKVSNKQIGDSKVVSEVRRPLTYSLITSCLGFFLFSFSPLPILKQFSFFCIMALIFTYLIVTLILPIIIERTKERSAKSFSINQWHLSFLNRKSFIFLLGLFLLISLFQLSRSPQNYNIRTYSQSDPGLNNDEIFIKDVLKNKMGPGYFIIQGKDPNEVLQNEEILSKKLEENQVQGVFVSAWIPSKEKQKESLEAYRALGPTLNQLSREIGLPWDFNFTSAGTLSFEDWKIQSIKLPIFQNWMGELDGEFSSIVQILEGSSLVDFSDLNTEKVTYIDKVSLINGQLKEFSKNLIIGVSLFLLVLLIALSIKFRMKDSLLILGPPVSALLISLAGGATLLNQVNLFQLLGGILVFALGIDYSFFFYFNDNNSPETYEGVTLSCLTTLFSFGVLCLSSTTAVVSFGLTVVIGITVSWVISPLSFKGSRA